MARVLVMDDEDELRGVMVRALRRVGHEAIEAADGAEGLAQIKAQPVDLVVTDILMPEVDGLEFIQELARLRPGTRVIAVSGGGVMDASSLLTVAGMLGAIRTLRKPFELAEFLSLVDEELVGGAKEARNRPAIVELVAAINRGDRAALDKVFTQDVVMEWPQSGERIRGGHNRREVYSRFPSLPKVTPRRTTGSGDVWVLEAALDYGDGEPYQCVFVFEMRDGLIAKETAYWSKPFPAPEWRAPWVERM